MTATDAERSAALLSAKAFYNAELRGKLEPTEKGKYIVIDAESHDYEVDSSLIVATVHLQDRQPYGQTLALRIGYDTTLRLPLRQRDSHSGAGLGQTKTRQKTEKAVLTAFNRSPASLQAEAFYNTELRANLEPTEKGKYVVIDAESHDYEVDGDIIAAGVHLLDRQPDADMFVFCIGYDSEQYALHGLPMRILG